MSFVYCFSCRSLAQLGLRQLGLVVPNKGPLNTRVAEKNKLEKIEIPSLVKWIRVLKEMPLALKTRTCLFLRAPDIVLLVLLSKTTLMKKQTLD